jgi:uncharacterized protein (DUF2235 family)
MLMGPSKAGRKGPAKSILLFSDGTGNSSGKLFKTNVWRTYEAVDLGLAPKGERVQVAYYDNGVGTSKIKPLAWLGGIFGFGLQRNVRAIYQFVCRNYCDGDRIYCFGFSRGAFTIRLVAALLATRGIVTYDDERELKARTHDVLRNFQRENEPNLVPYLTRFNRWVRTKLIAAKRWLVGPHHPIQTHFGGKDIAFVGVWDTVAAYGGPSAEVTRAIDNFIYPLTMTDQCLSEQVQVARHALCLDDERDAFHPVLWNEWDWARKARKARKSPAARAKFERRLQQVWFVGMHSDVGGGYPDESLSYVSLAWMMKEAADQGVRFMPGAQDRVRQVSNSLGPIHNSRGGLASYYRYQPRRIEAFFHEDAVGEEEYEQTRSYRDPVQGERDYPPRGFLLSCKVHESVAARIAYGTDDYAPIVLPPKFRIEPFNFDGAGGNPRVDPGDQDALTQHRPNWEQQREHLYDKVWWRRAAYFLTVLFTVLLVTLPLYAERVMYPSTIDGQWVFGRLTSWANIIPGFLQPWVRAFQTAPVVFLGLLVLAIAGSIAGTTLERSIRSTMRRLWTNRLARRRFTKPKESWIQRSRTAKPYQHMIQDLKWYILPAALGILMLAGILYVAIVLVTQFWLSMVDPDLCKRSRDNPYELPTRTLLPTPGAASFDTSKPCNPTGVQVQSGQPYAIELAVPTIAGKHGPFPNWSDNGHPATPNGIPARTLGIWGYAGGPLRRLVDANYLQVLFQIRPKNRDEARHPVIVDQLRFTRVDKGNPKCWIYRADFVAKQPGELLLFANDSVAFRNARFFYDNNRGTARVYVHELHGLGEEPEKSAALQDDPCQLGRPAAKAGGGKAGR